MLHRFNKVKINHHRKNIHIFGSLIIMCSYTDFHKMLFIIYTFPFFYFIKFWLNNEPTRNHLLRLQVLVL